MIVNFVSGYKRGSRPSLSESTAILFNMDAKKISNVANKALIAAEPHYHSWSTRKQEVFRATLSEAAQSRVEAVLLNDLLGIQCTAESAEEIWRDLPTSNLNNLNWAKLLITGIGDDMIFLNESMAKRTSLLDFETLYDYDYDYDDHLFQEKSNKEEFENHVERDYYAFRFSLWARLLISDRFYYSTFYSLAGYLIEYLENKTSDIIQTLIPHEYVDGKNQGKPEKGGFLWDIQVDAAGLEKQLDELNSRWYQYTQQRWLELSKQFAQCVPAVYTQDKNENDENHWNFIFNNERALKKVRWRHLLTDCEAMEGDYYANVDDWEQQELATATHWLQKTHEDILRNFDPGVVKLKGRRKIVIAPGAFDGIGGDGYE